MTLPTFACFVGAAFWGFLALSRDYNRWAPGYACRWVGTTRTGRA